MIIRNQVIWMQKASPLNNRVVRSTPGRGKYSVSTLKESPTYAAGALFQSATHGPQPSAGPLDTAATERRRFQRPLYIKYNDYPHVSDRRPERPTSCQPRATPWVWWAGNARPERAKALFPVEAFALTGRSCASSLPRALPWADSS